MFNQSAIVDLLNDYGTLFDQIERVRTNLTKRFHGADDAIEGVLLATLSDLPCLLYGPPGVGKSLLIRTFCGMLGLNTQQGTEGREYFEYLLNKFTEPTELFGPFRLESVDGVQELRRVEDGMLHTCRVAFLDEVFNGSSAILNTLLALMNEGRFHDRGDIRESNLEMIFGATNFPPDTEDLLAVYDRFVIRVHMDNVERVPEELAAYLYTAAGAQRDLDEGSELFEDLLTRILEFRESLSERIALSGSASGAFDLNSEAGHTFLSNLSFIVEKAKADGVGSFSNRRIFQMCKVLLVRRLLEARRASNTNPALSFTDYQVIWKYFFDKPGVSSEGFEDVFDTTFAGWDDLR